MIGKKAKVIKTISTINGTLYEDDVVLVERSENGNYRVKDSMGRIWYVDKKNIGFIVTKQKKNKKKWCFEKKPNIYKYIKKVF